VAKQLKEQLAEAKDFCLDVEIAAHCDYQWFVKTAPLHVLLLTYRERVLFSCFFSTVCTAIIVVLV